MRERWENIVFLCLCGIVLFLGLLTFVKPQSETSTSENRTLAKFEQLSLDGFLDGSFQDGFESALSDQFLLSEEIRVGYNRVLASLPTFGLNDSVCAGRYLELANSVDRRRATFNCEDYMLYWPEELSEEKNNILLENVKKYNHMNKIMDMYYYFVDDSSVYNFEMNKKAVDYVSILKEKLSGDYNIREFDYGDYEGYKELFYKTDHHWDYRGSYRGYLEIAEMLGINQPVKYASIETNHEDYFGSLARNTNNYDVKEEFDYYTFDLGPYDTLINGSVGKYGHLEEYREHEYDYDQTVNYYAYLYGGDEGEIVFDFHQPKKDNLLIISNSYSNPIDALIASHFNKTYVVDTRHYKQFMGSDFVFSEYVREKKIDKTLVIMSPTFVTEPENNQGLEG